MIFAALTEAADRGELLLTDGGMCRFHRRRDAVVVVLEVIVLPERRGEGIGRRLVGEVIARAGRAAVRAKCPTRYTSNGFWRHMGFRLAGQERTRSGFVNRWEYSPAAPNS
jgi:GNAT superfamily N-acetyltransferase